MLCHVTAMNLILKKNHSRKADGGPVWFYRVVDVSTSDPRIATAVWLAGLTSPHVETNQFCIKEIGPVAEWIILADARRAIDEIHKNRNRCILVVELTNFPLVVAYVDRRDQVAVFSDGTPIDKFGNDVIRTWLTYDSTKSIPCIFVNTCPSFVGLKILSL